MSDLHVFRPHTLGLDGARRAADEVAARLHADLGMTTEWRGEVLHVSGHGVDGQIAPGADTIDVRARLGLLARPFRRRLLREIEQELDRSLALSPSS